MSILNVDKIQPIGSGSTVTVNATDTILTNAQAGVITATRFDGIISATTDDWITHQGDSNTKFGFSATDTFAVETAGSERLRIDSSGHVIIANKLTNSASYTSHNTNFYGGNVNTGGVRIEVAHSTTSVSGNTASASFPHHLLLSNYSGTGSADNRMCSIGFDIPTTSTHANAVIAYQATAAGTGDLQFHLESGNSITERLRIKSNGNISIGQTAGGAPAFPGNLVHIEKSSADPLVTIKNTSGQENQGACLKLWASGRGSGVDDEDILLTTDYQNNRVFGVSNAGTVNTTGDIKMANGKGISFINAADTATGETVAGSVLDEYEHGTWSLAVATGTVSFDRARYIRIGKLVHLWGRIWNPTNVSSSNVLTITGLPYAVSQGVAGGSMFGKEMNQTDATTAFVNTAENLSFYAGNSGNAWTQLRHNQLHATSTEIYFHVTYYTT